MNIYSKVLVFAFISLISSAIFIPKITQAADELDINQATCEYIAIDNNPIANGSTYSTPIVQNKNFIVTIKMKNTGEKTWTKSDQYRLGSYNDNTFWGTSRIELPANSVAPGDEIVFTKQFTAPSVLDDNPNSTYPFQWQMLRERKVQNGDVIDAGGRFGIECNVNLLINTTGNQCPNINVINAIPANLQMIDASNGETFLTWSPVLGATYNIRIEDTNKEVDTAEVIGASSGNNCSNNEGYDVCLNGWTDNNMHIKVTPGHSYKWWVDIVPSTNSCPTISDTDRKVNTFYVQDSSDSLNITAKTTCTDYKNNQEKFTVNWTLSPKAKSYNVDIRNNVNPDGTRRSVYDYSDTSECLSGNINTYTTQKSLPASANYRATVKAYTDQSCTTLLPTVGQNIGYSIFPTNGGFFSPNPQKNPANNQYYYFLDSVSWLIDQVTYPIKLQTCQTTKLTLPIPQGKNNQSPFDVPIKIIPSKSRPHAKGTGTEIVKGGPKTVIMRYTPVVTSEEGEVKLRPDEPANTTTDSDTPVDEGGEP